MKQTTEKDVYKFQTKKSKDYEGVVLADDTHIMVGKKKMHILFPKDKFVEIFNQQIKENRNYIGVTFDEIEIDAIIKGLESLTKK